MTARARIAVVGLGRIGRVHAESLANVPTAELVRVADSVEAAARRVGDALGVVWSTSYDDVLEDGNVDGVVIATPTPFHAEMIERAAQAFKHVFVEKPLALDLPSSTRALEAARSAGVLLQVGFHRRFDPDWQTAADRIRAGALGDLYLFRTTFREPHPPPAEYIRASGDFFMDVTIHDFDLARWLVGEVVEIGAFTASLSSSLFEELAQPDHAIVTLRFANGALGVIDNSRAAGYGYECSTEIVGSRATLRIGGDHSPANVTFLADGAMIRTCVDDFADRFATAYRAEIEHFVDSVRARRAPTVTGEDAVAAFLLATAARRSVQQNRPVSVGSSPTADGAIDERDAARSPLRAV